MKPDICVVMSTYNGEKYIKDQIESIFSQEGVNVFLFVRDDGSTDRTLEILETYNNERIKIIRGENIGAKDSFLEALSIAPLASYYAFSDQDDVWDSDKLSVAVGKLKESNAEIPSLYCGRTRQVYEKNRGKQGTSSKEKMVRPFLFGEPIMTPGCTMVFNRSLKGLLDRYHPRVFAMHDAWLRDLCLAVDGKIIYDNIPHMTYRQHENNVVGGKRSFFTSVKRTIRFYQKMGANYHIRMYSELSEHYKDCIPKINMDRMEKVCGYNKSFSSRIGLLRDKDFLRGSKKYKFITGWLVASGKY